MSVTGNAGIGMPIILLHDAEGGIITVELKNGETCRGLLDEAEDSMNLVLKVKLSCSPNFLEFSNQAFGAKLLDVSRPNIHLRVTAQ